MKLRYILFALAIAGVFALASCSNESNIPDEVGSGTASESETASGLIDAGVYSDESGEWGPLVGLGD